MTEIDIEPRRPQEPPAPTSSRTSLYDVVINVVREFRGAMLDRPVDDLPSSQLLNVVCKWLFAAIGLLSAAIVLIAACVAIVVVALNPTTAELGFVVKVVGGAVGTTVGGTLLIAGGRKVRRRVKSRRRKDDTGP